MNRRVNVFSGATIPQPLVQELPQEAAWDEWSKAVEVHEAKFAPTAPASLSMKLARDTRYDPTTPATLDSAPPIPQPTARQVQLSLDEVLQESKRSNRVCPNQSQWTRMYVMLAQHRHGSTRLPPPPLTGKAWDVTPVLAKRMSFHAHLEWASMHGCLGQVHAFLKGLPEDAWYCGS